MGEEGEVAKMSHFLEQLKAGFVQFRALCPFAPRQEKFQEDGDSSFWQIFLLPRTVPLQRPHLC